MFQKYEEALDWITKLMPQAGIKPGLERTQALLEKLGHPERRLKFIHVAGTNGKGSTCAFLAAALQTAGYDVGMFTSPYLEKYTNRIQVNGGDIPEETVVDLVNRIKPVADELATVIGEASMFEISTVLAILYFATVSYPDIVVWETGMGGRLDSTNAVVPLVSVITNVGIDHTDILGDSLEKIAYEKAGIIKAGVPVVSAVTHPEAAEIIRKQAQEKKSSLYELGTHFNYVTREVQEGRQSFDFEGLFRNVPNVTLSMDGIHQLSNAALAIMTLEVLRQFYAVFIDDEQLYPALEETRWKGRMEIVSQHPRILLDGAHNEDGAHMLAKSLASVYRYRKLYFVLGMLPNKNHKEYLRHILPIVETLIITEPDFFKKMPVEDLALAAQDVMKESGRECQLAVEPDWKQAVERARRSAEPEDLIVVSGSLYLVADVRSRILNQHDSEKGW